MPDRDPRRLAAWAVAALALLLLAGLYFVRSRPDARAAPPPAASIEVRPSGGGRVVVDVAGEVERPGVYRLAAGARVEHALERAGGATRRADLSQINRAAKLEDGRQILVPARARPGEAAVAATGPDAAGAPINLNTATLEQLDTLDGVGPATAQKILDFREERGGFGSVEELDQIPGIGEKRLASLRERVRL
jgi:competence protein ComEA